MGRIYKLAIKTKARKLRNQGWSLGEISRKMHIPRNTLSGWVKNIRLTEKQNERIRQKIIDSGAIGRPLAVKANREKIERWKENIRRKVENFGKFASGNPQMCKLICGILYLCEGAKYPSSQVMAFGNSDPEMIKTFLGLLRKYFNIQEEKLHCRIIPRWDQDINELQCFWSKITKIPISRFYKTKPDKRTKGKKTLKERYKGVCVLQYCDTSLQFGLQAIGESVIRGGV
ncbi:MAG: hypothetical protein WC628_00485 [Candidatus Omnitrophota bacterium]